MKPKSKIKTPKNKCWIVAVDTDSFNYEPSLELISAVKKHNRETKEGIKMYRKKETVQKMCDIANSL